MGYTRGHLPQGERAMTPEVRDFPALVRWLADTYHRGAVYHVGASVGISQSTVDKWVRGRATPTIDLLAKLCGAYKVDLYKAVDLVRATKPRKPRAVIASLVLAALTLGWVPAYAGTPPAPARDVELLLIGTGRRLRKWLAGAYGYRLTGAATGAA